MKLFKFILTIFLIKISMAGSFSELIGIEDNSGNTHLYYRIYYIIPAPFGDGYDESIYHYDLFNLVDTLFLEDYVKPQYLPWPYGGGGNIIQDVEFWDHDPSKYVYSSYRWGTDIGTGYVNRYDSLEVYQLWGSLLSSLEISNQNDSNLFVSDVGILIKSTNGGYTWGPLISYVPMMINVSPFDDNILFAADYDYLYKSIDGGLTYSVVDSSRFWGDIFYFDADSYHIYAVNSISIIRSSDFGDNWEIIYSDTVSLHMSIDPLISGLVYYSKNNQILVSNDFGNTFQVHAELDNPIIGFYKKPMIDKIYAATAGDIYEIDSTGIHLIKHLTAIENDEYIAVIPTNYELDQNFPNPFNSTTTISYKIKESGHIRILLFDVSGQKIEVLLDKNQTPGDYHFQWDARDMASGIYFYLLIVNDNPVSTRKMVLIK